VSGGWEVGDLAIKKRGPCGEIPRGTILRVCGFYNHPTGMGLLFKEFPYPGGYYHYNFDKIKPDTEPCEEEFTTLIKRGRKVDA
jgi:hypothetical protein